MLFVSFATEDGLDKPIVMFWTLQCFELSKNKRLIEDVIQAYAMQT